MQFLHTCPKVVTEKKLGRKSDIDKKSARLSKKSLFSWKSGSGHLCAVRPTVPEFLAISRNWYCSKSEKSIATITILETYFSSKRSTRCLECNFYKPAENVRQSSFSNFFRPMSKAKEEFERKINFARNVPVDRYNAFSDNPVE